MESYFSHIMTYFCVGEKEILQLMDCFHCGQLSERILLTLLLDD